MWCVSQVMGQAVLHARQQDDAILQGPETRCFGKYPTFRSYFKVKRKGTPLWVHTA